jgi:hypothetical protein
MSLPRAAVVLLTDPAEAPQAAIERAGADMVDLATLPLLMPAVWQFTAAQRSEIVSRLVGRS